MKIDINDPRITSFALGELHGHDAKELAQAVQNDPKIREAVDDVRATAFFLNEVFHGESNTLTDEHRKTIQSASPSPIVTDSSNTHAQSWKKWLVAGTAIAAVITLSLISVLQQKNNANKNLNQVAKQTAPTTENLPYQRISTENLKGNSWHHLDAQSRWSAFPIPTFSKQGSWALLQSYVDEQHELPPRHNIHINELINHFQYAPPQKFVSSQVAGEMAISNCPWNDRLLLLGIHIKTSSTNKNQAPQINLNLNSQAIESVRLIGYSLPANTKNNQTTQPTKNNQSANTSFEQVIIYAITPRNDKSIWDNTKTKKTLNLVSIKINDTIASTVTYPLHNNEEFSANLRFATLLAATGLIVTNDQELGTITRDKLRDMLDQVVLDTQQTNIPPSLKNERSEAIRIIQKVIEIAK